MEWKSKKLLGIVLLLIAPFVLVLVFLRGCFLAMGSPGTLQSYRLEKDFQEAQVKTIAFRMKKEKEFENYFYLLDDISVGQAVRELYPALDQARDQASFLQLVHQLQENIERTAILFKNVRYPKDFSKNPSKYPEMAEVLWRFFYEEFKLSIVGLSYMATYDPNFRFIWNPEIRSVADYLKSIAFSIPVEERKKMNHFLYPSTEPKSKAAK
ncbi:MAG: hypothetical protein NUV91_02900 [Candidatus Omnitrophica bacterium]|nr:hypothetical protein [Candidatus Omnitrophota bacterium]